MDNKKVLGISIAAVVILVIAIIATSYAVFTANLTGTKENKLTTGFVRMNCEETTFNDTKTYENDAAGIASATNTNTCVLTADAGGTMTVGYDVVMSEVSVSNQAGFLTANDIKVQVKKTIGSNITYPVGTETTGVTLSALASSMGTYDTSLPYKLDSASINVSSTEQTITYAVKSWAVAATGSGGITEKCSDSQYLTETACESAGEIWGTSQTTSQAGVDYSYKLKIGATQVS